MKKMLRVWMRTAPGHLHAGALSAIPLLSLLIAGCATAQAAPQEGAISRVYTAVALTVSGASTNTSPTATLTSSAASTIPPFTSTAFPTATPTSGALYTYASGCNNAAYVRDVTVADGEDMAPGETFTKTWALLNTGNCAWSKSYSVVFVSGSDMGASFAYLDTTVAMGAYADVSVELTSPEDEGAFTGYWQLADASGARFGEQIYVQIVVSGDAATSTSTPTSTATPTATAETATPTSTPSPSTEPSTGTLEPVATTEFTLTPKPESITTSSPTETPHAKNFRA